MPTSLQKYKPLIEIISYDGEKHYLDANAFETLRSSLESSKFIDLGGTLIASSSIRLIRPYKQAEGVPPEYKESIEERKKEYKFNTGRIAEADVINSWIEKLRKGENLSNKVTNSFDDNF